MHIPGTAKQSDPFGHILDASLTTTGVAQQVLAAQTTRSHLLLQNISDVDMWVDYGGLVPSATSGILLKSGGGSITYNGTTCFVDEVQVYCAFAGKRFTCKYLP